MRKRGGAVIWISLALAIAAGCASHQWPRPVNAEACGNPCASLNCPSAYRCAIDGQCVPRCEAEPLGNKLY